MSTDLAYIRTILVHRALRPTFLLLPEHELGPPETFVGRPPAREQSGPQQDFPVTCVIMTALECFHDAVFRTEAAKPKPPEL